MEIKTNKKDTNTICTLASGAVAMLTIATGSTTAQQEGVYTIYHYKSEDSGERDNVNIAYVTYCTLNDDKLAAVLPNRGTITRTVLRRDVQVLINETNQRSRLVLSLISKSVLKGDSNNRPKKTIRGVANGVKSNKPQKPSLERRP